MKRFLLLLMLVPVLAFSQNGGQSNENNVVKVEFLGHTTLDQFKVTSKQNCTASYRIIYDNLDSVISIPPLGEVILSLAHINYETFKAKAVQGTTCTNQPDMGWVEVTSGVILALDNRDKLKSPLRAQGITVYPTIISDHLSIRVGRDVKRPVMLQLFDLNGQERSHILSFSDQINIDLSRIAPGSYILTVHNGNGTKLGFQKLVKVTYGK